MNQLSLIIYLFCAFSVLINESEKLNEGVNDPILNPIKIDGLSFVAPPRPFPENPMPAIQQVNADWIALIPFAYTRQNEPNVYYDTQRQWWGEKTEGIVESIKLAKKANIKILMKPQVYIPGSWAGDLDFPNNEQWEAWEAAYKEYILEFTNIAAEYELEMLCIGTEFKLSVARRPQFWSALIKEVRSIYNGPITYAANWDSYQQIPFWKELDYAGIDAYFPLVDAKVPSVSSLKKAWKPIVKEIESFHKKINKPILFTEFGYMSLEGCAYNTWELESNRRSTSISQQAQANALEALFSTFRSESWWHGGFLWKWFPNMQGHEGYLDKDYTPQGKMANEVIKKHYQ